METRPIAEGEKIMSFSFFLTEVALSEISRLKSTFSYSFQTNKEHNRS